MRTIKFRSKTLGDNNVWVFGDLHIRSAFAHIHTGLGTKSNIDTDTIGQFTGLYDKDGKEIYEGDILSRKDGGALLKVEFRHGAFGYEYCGEFHSWAGNHNFTFNPFDTDVDFAIIGNIHDNPELLK